jgi:hypothetical protein
MGLIETLDNAENRLLRERSLEAARVFDSAVLPIYTLEVPGRNAQVKPGGTCLLLSIDGHSILSTAAHVLDAHANGKEVYVGGTNGLVPMKDGKNWKTIAPRGDRTLDHLDCGFWDIPGDAVSALGNVDFIDSSKLSPNRAPTDRRYYYATGYRFSRNKKLIANGPRTITPARSGYSGTVSANPALASAMSISGSEHLFLNFGKDVSDEAGNPANAFDPVGFSGGPLLDLGDFTDVDAYSSGTLWRPTLSGMLIEHKPTFNAMVAVRIEWVVEWIRRTIRA